MNCNVRRFLCLLLSVVMVFGMLPAMSAFAAETETIESGITRIYGEDRYETAFGVADALKELKGVEAFETVVVACGTEFADALSGSYLAASQSAPILLTNDTHADEVKEYIGANLKPGGKVYILGGTDAVPAEMESGLDGFEVKRLYGNTRFATNLEILKEAGTEGKDILVCTGWNFADALSASAVCQPIMLVSDELTVEQKTFLETVTGKLILIGGVDAVSAEIENALKAYGETERLDGETRYETSVMVAQRFFENPEQTVLAYAWNFPDGLCGGVLANAMGGPVILTDTGAEDAAAAYVQGEGIEEGVVLGGSILISDSSARKIFGYAETYTVSFETNGGSTIEPQVVEAGSLVACPDDPVRDGYYFVAWYSNEELTEVYDFDAPVEADTTLYAKWYEIADEEHGFIDEDEPDVEVYSFDTDTWDIVVGETATVTFTAEIFAEIEIGENTVAVIDDSSNVIGYMNDDGTAGDAAADDGIYTLQVGLKSEEESVVTYYASAEGAVSYGVTISYYIQRTAEDYEVAQNVGDVLDETAGEFLDENGYLIEGNEEAAIAALSTKLDELIEEGAVSSYTVNGMNVSVTLPSGVKFAYMLLVSETDAGIGSGTIATYQPFKDTYSSGSLNTKSDQATDGSAQTIVDEFDNYGWSTNLDLNSVTLASLKNMASYSVVLWHGHGGHNIIANEGSSLAIGQLSNSTTSAAYNADISANRILLCYAAGRSVYAITGGFVQKYVGRMDGAFLYLAACDSGVDMLSATSETYNLSQAFINKGATAVVANDATICTKYNTAMERDTVAAMCEINESTLNYNTLAQALQIAFSENGEYCCNTNKANPVIFPQNNTAARNYRLGYNEVGYMSGSVKDASTEETISNALVRVYDNDGNEVTSTRTDSNGGYYVKLSTGEYVVKISAGSYKSVKMTVVINANATTYNETFLMISNGLSAGYANGTITNSITEVAVPYVTLKFRKNWNNQTGTVVYTSSTNDNGYYEVTSSELPAGFYTMEMIKSGYITGYKNIFISPIDVSAQNAVLSPVTSDGTYRIVLSWGEAPRDLDSHFNGVTDSGSRDHIYYSNKTGYTGNLDVDDTSSYGPETITVTDFAGLENGFTYSVHDYTNRSSSSSTALSGSGACVKLYRGSELLRTYYVPTGRGGTVWNVFSVDANGNITDLNTFAYVYDPSSVGLSSASAAADLISVAAMEDLEKDYEKND